MKTHLQKSIPRFSPLLMAALLAVMSAFALAHQMSSTDGLLKSALRPHDTRLTQLSERAERLQAFSRHIRKASYTPDTYTNAEIPFAGIITTSMRIAPGARITVADTIAAAISTLEVVSAHKVNSALMVSGARPLAGDLMLVQARTVGDAADTRDVRFLVLVKSPKPATDAVLDQQTL